MLEPSSPNFSLTFRLTINEVYKASRAIALSNVGKIRRVLWIVLAVPITAGLFLLVAKGFGFQVAIRTNEMLIVLVVPAVLFYAYYVAPYFAARSLFKTSANVQNPIHWYFSDDTITQQTATARAEYLWSTFMKVQETQDLFLFYVQKRLAYLVPKRAFGSPQDLTDFRDLVRRHVRNASLRRD